VFLDTKKSNWNRLLREIVESPSLEIFKILLEAVLYNML